MSNIPAARLILSEVLSTLKRGQCSTGDAVEMIGKALSLMTRDKVVRRAPEKSKAITPEMRARIWQLADTDMHMSEIGHQLGINQGRVSEVLRGKR